MVRAPYRAQAHCSVLVWFGLAEHSPEKRSGLYKITEAGHKFLANEYMVPAIIWSRDGRVVDRDQRLTGIDSVKNVVFNKNYWDAYPSVQRQYIKT